MNVKSALKYILINYIIKMCDEYQPSIDIQRKNIQSVAKDFLKSFEISHVLI
jgi:hypothetical protein